MDPSTIFMAILGLGFLALMVLVIKRMATKKPGELYDSYEEEEPIAVQPPKPEPKKKKDKVEPPKEPEKPKLIVHLWLRNRGMPALKGPVKRVLLHVCQRFLARAPLMTR